MSPVSTPESYVRNETGRLVTGLVRVTRSLQMRSHYGTKKGIGHHPARPKPPCLVFVQRNHLILRVVTSVKETVRTRGGARTRDKKDKQKEDKSKRKREKGARGDPYSYYRMFTSLGFKFSLEKGLRFRST